MSNTTEYIVKFSGVDGLSPVADKVTGAVGNVSTTAVKAVSSAAHGMQGAASAYSQAVDRLKAEGDMGATNLRGSIAAQKQAIKDLEKEYDQLKAKTVGMPADVAQKHFGNAFNELRAEIESEKDALEALEASQAEYGRSAVTVRTQLSHLREEMMAMSKEGKKGTPEYAELRKELERLGTISKEVNAEQAALSTGATQWGGVISGLQGLMGAYAVGSGVVSLFVKDNEKLQKVQTGLQATMSIMMGVQQVANTVHETSAFRITTCRLATELWTCANKALSTSLHVSTAAAKGLTAAMSLGISVAIGAVISVASNYISKLNEQRRAQKEAAKQQQEAYDSARQSAASSVGEQLASYRKLQAGWNALGDDMLAKRKYITDNADAFDVLGVAVTDVVDAENLLVANESAFVASLQAKAKAAASMELATQHYKAAIEAAIAIESANVPTDDDKKAAKKYARKQYKSQLDSVGIVGFGKLLAQKDDITSQAYTDYLTKVGNDRTAEYNDIIAKENALGDQYISAVNNNNNAVAAALSGAGIKQSVKGTKGTGGTGSDTSYLEGTVGYYDDIISKLNERIKQSSDRGEIAALQLQVELNEGARDTLLGKLKTWEERLADMFKIPVQVVPKINTTALNNSFGAFAEGLDVLEVEPIEIESNIPAITDTVNTLGTAFQNLYNVAGEGSGVFSGVASALAGTASAIASTISAYVALGAAKSFASHPTLLGVAKVATVIGGILAVISSVRNAIPKFAAGGIAYGPTLGLFGEYSGAATNPEVVAPLDKLQAMLAPAGGMSGEVEFRVRGRNLYAVLKNETKRRNRIR